MTQIPPIEKVPEAPRENPDESPEVVNEIIDSMEEEKVAVRQAARDERLALIKEIGDVDALVA